jgi:acetoacetate decarboxylase
MKTIDTPASSAKTVVGLDLAGAFTMPLISPMATPPPFFYKNCHSVNILFHTDATVLSKLVPAPLQADPTRPLIFYIGLFQFALWNNPYNEAGLLVPVIHEGKPAGTFAVVLYLDRASPIVGGREIYGWPKKDAEEVLFHEEAGKITAGVTRYGHKIIEVSFEAQQKVEPIPERPSDPIHLLKLIPSVREAAPPDVLQLTSMALSDDVVREMHTGKATLRFGASPFDSFLAEIPVGDIVYAESIVHDFTMGHGEIVVDYLAGAR